ncbi:MAG: hypothetical protein C4521_09540 [Actinobacteria bacterium]|nr:MAG: hypothetical protein C4521_09540 [Actinomycetota bacterium]
MSDLFYHVAGVQSLLSNNQALVTDPMFGLRGLPVDPTSGTFHTFLAFAARLAGLDGFHAFEWLEPVVVAVYFIAFFAFARRLLPGAGQAFVALLLFAAVIWSLDFRVVIYPKWLDPAVYWMGLVLFLAYLEKRYLPALALATIFAATTALVHLATAELWGFTMIAAVGWALLLHRRLPDGRGLLARTGIGALVSLVPLILIVWRRSSSVLLSASTSVFNPPANSPMSDLPFVSIGKGFGIIRGGTFHQWYQGGDAMLLFVVAALGVLLYKSLSREADARTLLVGAAASIMPVLMLNLVWTNLIVTKYWFHLRRMAYVLRFVPALLLPYVAGVAVQELRGRRLLGVLLVFALLSGSIAFAGVEVIGAFNRFVNPLSLDNFGRQRHNAVRKMSGVTEYLKRRAAPGVTVAAQEKTSYYLAALVPARVIAVRRPHMPLAVEVREGPRRRHDQSQIFNERVTPGKTRRLLRLYRARYVLASRKDRALDKFERMGLRVVFSDESFFVLSVPPADREAGA